MLIDCKAERFAGPIKQSAVELQDGAFDELARFLGSVFGGDTCRWRGSFEHWWTLNPAWNASLPRGWLIRSNEGSIIAFTANIPLSYVVDGEPGLCCATGCTAVDPGFRGLGLAKTVGREFLNQTHGDLLVGVDSTPPAFGLWRSLGMKALDARWQRKRMQIVADGYLLASRLSTSAPPAGFLGRSAGHCLRLLLDSAAALSRRSTSLTIELIDGFNARDGGSVEACRASDAATFARRDVATLNWLYFDTQYVRRTRTVLVARSGAEIAGYLVIKRWGRHSYQLLECRCREADPTIARQLLWAARDFARKVRAESIVVRPYTPMIEAAVPALLSIPLEKPAMTYCYKFRAGKMNLRDWETGPGDGDLSVN